jgi:hypothetical protein
MSHESRWSEYEMLGGRCHRVQSNIVYHTLRIGKAAELLIPRERKRLRHTRT